MKRKILALVFGCTFFFIYLAGVGAVSKHLTTHLNQSVMEIKDSAPPEPDSIPEITSAAIIVFGGCLLGIIPALLIGFIWCDPASITMKEEKKNKSITRSWLALGVIPAVFLFHFLDPSVRFIDLTWLATGMFLCVLTVSHALGKDALEPYW